MQYIGVSSPTTIWVYVPDEPGEPLVVTLVEY